MAIEALREPVKDPKPILSLSEALALSRAHRERAEAKKRLFESLGVGIRIVGAIGLFYTGTLLATKIDLAGVVKGITTREISEEQSFGPDAFEVTCSKGDSASRGRHADIRWSHREPIDPVGLTVIVVDNKNVPRWLRTYRGWISGVEDTLHLSGSDKKVYIIQGPWVGRSNKSLPDNPLQRIVTQGKCPKPFQPS
ncbi:hypothetical protein HYW43_03795 [Candidatus Daviesbacteria bacterium]|nr:hypothetical protein [Candidatus Daviesbacteria bacterium]